MNSTSIYIPRMSTRHTEASIKNIMLSFGIGNVERVDFTPINKKPGFGEHVDDVVMSAFVHFSSYMSDSYIGVECWDMISRDQPYRLHITYNEYWICLKNKNPVKRTMMNVHQIVENGRYLENLVEEQKNKIQELEEKIDNMDSVIRQFIGGLFCQKTQEGILELHCQVLDGEGSSPKPLPENTSKWTSWPTTRQGDECEKRIENLEHIVQNIFNPRRDARIAPMFDCEEQDSYLLMRKHENSNMDCDNCSVSTHSSMPDLIEIEDDASVSSHSSIPDLIDDDSSVDSYNRIRNSYELCGNE